MLLVDRIAALSKRDWKGRKEGAPVGDITLRFKDDLQAYCFPFEGKKFENLLIEAQTMRKEMDENFYIYLPPMYRESHFIPVMRLVLDLPANTVNLRVELHTFPQNQSAPQGIGIRFECPMGTSGSHSYHHVQLFRPNGNSFEVPESFPALPLPAHDPLSLLLCLIIALYGREELGRFIDDLNLRTDLRDRLRMMLFRVPVP